MKQMTTFFKTLLAVVAVAGFGTTTVNAATFTAIASGNFSANSTWSGGVAPGTMVSGDDIIIPIGLNVNLDQDLMLSSSASLTVLGSLQSTGQRTMSVVSSSMTGTGSIMVDSFAASFTSGFSYTGTITARAMSVSNATFSAVTNINITESLTVNSGTLNLGSSTFALGNNTTIIMDGGTITLGSATLTLTNNYNVEYRGSSATAGIELSGSGLNDVTVNVGSGNSVTLSDDLNVKGDLMLTSGELNLNGNDLMISGSGDVMTSAGAMIKASGTEDLSFTSSNSITGALSFSANGNTVNDVTINFSNSSSSVELDNDLNVSGTLSLQNGMIDLNDNTLTLETGAMLSGGSSSSFVIATEGGMLAAEVMSGSSTMFMIGTENDFAPVVLTGNSGSATAEMTASVNPNVMVDGTTGADASATQPMVDFTWFVENNTSASVDVKMEVMWDAAAEVNGFDRTKAYISHYVNAEWDATASAAATTTGSGMYAISRDNITSFSPFAVFDEQTSVSVENVANADVTISLYPNPATDVLNIRYDGNQAVTAEVFSMNGQLVQTTTLEAGNGTINTSALNNGMYYIRLSGEGVTGTQKFIKQ